MIRAFLLIVLLLAGAPAYAGEKFLDIQTVTSDKGITAWLVEDQTLPIIAIRFSFLDSGSALESAAQQGLAQLLSNTMDEGAGDMTSSDFQKALMDHSITLRFTSGRDGFGGRLKTLTRHKDEAFRLLALSLTSPRFDEEPVQRMKDANLSRIRSSLTDPEWMAARIMNDKAFAGHPYAQNSGGTMTTLAALTADDLRRFQRTYLTRDRLRIGVAGDITADELKTILDDIFGALPDKAPDSGIAATRVGNRGNIYLYRQDIPQTVISIMMPAFGRKDKDYYALQVLNYIFGGAGFGSRLMEEAREKRGLTYGIYSGIVSYRHADALSISTSTKNETAAQALQVIRAEMNRLVNEPVSESELDDAKSYLTGSLPLSLGSTEHIAGILLSLQEDDLPADYLDHYAERIGKVSTADLQRVATRILDKDAMTIVVTGQPDKIDDAVVIEALPNVH